MAGDELLSAFKVASFTLDEDEEVSKLDSIHDENTKDWVSKYCKSNYFKYSGVCIESQKHLRYLSIFRHSVIVVNV